MTADDRWLEEQLEQLCPVRPSSRVEAGVARRLAPSRTTARRTALAALAATVLLLWLLWPPSPRPAAPGQAVKATPPPTLAAPLPSLALYRQALAESPEALERLLNRPPAEEPASEPEALVAVSSSAFPNWRH